MIHFDLDNRYLDEQAVGTAITRREGVLLSVTFHTLLALAIIVGPRLPFFQPTPEELRLRQEQERQRLELQQQNRTFVFVKPRVDLEAKRPPERAELSDKDRIARAPEPAPTPRNPLPFSRGNTTDRVEESKSERARGPETPAPPSPGDVPPEAEHRPLPPSENGLTLPREAPQARAGSGSLGEALRNLQRYVQRDQFENPQGGGGQFGPEIQFDTKGVEFGPWIRRFVAQVKRNWFIPYAAMSMKGHVVITFNVHKDGTITDLTVVGPCPIDAFNNAAFGALMATNPTQPIPPAYPDEKAFFTVTFFYNEVPPRQ